MYLIAESMRRTIEQSLVPDAPRPLPKVRGRAFGGCHREGDVKSGEHGDEGIGRIASAAGKVLQVREGDKADSQLLFARGPKIAMVIVIMTGGDGKSLTRAGHCDDSDGRDARDNIACPRTVWCMVSSDPARSA